MGGSVWGVVCGGVSVWGVVCVVCSDTMTLFLP